MFSCTEYFIVKSLNQNNIYRKSSEYLIGTKVIRFWVNIVNIVIHKIGKFIKLRLLCKLVFVLISEWTQRTSTLNDPNLTLALQSHCCMFRSTIAIVVQFKLCKYQKKNMKINYRRCFVLSHSTERKLNLILTYHLNSLTVCFEMPESRTDV